ncbi:MAG: PilZ domain-containing protein [Terricaulis sp.]
MSLLGMFNFFGNTAVAEPEAEPVERREETRTPCFQECLVALQDFHKIRAVIVNISARGACIHYSERTELPFRIRLSAPQLKLNCWARVVWQENESAGLEFLPELPVYD